MLAITYTNNDYGKGLADVYAAAVKAHGIKVTAVAAHEDGKADYSSEVATLASAGGDASSSNWLLRPRWKRNYSRFFRLWCI